MLKSEVISQKSKKIADVVADFNNNYIDEDAKTDIYMTVNACNLCSLYKKFFVEVFNPEDFSIFEKNDIAEYRDLLIAVLHDSDSRYDVDLHVRKNGEFGKSGRTSWEHDKVHVFAELGCHITDDVLISQFSEIKGVVHEIAHATSQRYSQGRFVFEKETLVGEIEAMFMEKLFVKYCIDNIDKVRDVILDKAVKGVPDEALSDFIGDMFSAGRFLNLQDRTEFCSSNKNPNGRKEFEFRYVVGEVYSTLLYEQYLKNPEKTLKKFVKFMSHNAEYNLDETARVLGIGNSKEQVFASFINNLSVDKEK